MSTRFDLTYQIDHARIAEDQRGDGVFPLITNDAELSEQEVLLVYKRQPVIENRFSQLKTDFSSFLASRSPNTVADLRPDRKVGENRKQMFGKTAEA